MGIFRSAIYRILLLLALGAAIPGLAQGQTPPQPNCNTVASPPPLATFGGPATAGRGNTELGLAVGAAGQLYPLPCGHEGGSNWLVRFRRGFSDRMDLGFDFQVENHGGGQGGTVKGALRYRVAKGLRLEGGVGVSDTGYAGGSANADVAAVLGTTNPDKPWNYYISLRLAGSRGLGGIGHPPGALIPLGVIGASARVADNVHFILETGLGEVFSREHPNPGAYVHFSFGVLFNVGRHNSRRAPGT